MNAKAIRYIDNIQSRYERLGYAPYRWLYADEAPAFTSIAKPISESRLGVVTTAGAYVAGQVAFHYKDDTSVRAIPSTTATEDMRFAHLTENYLVNARRDAQCLVPLDALQTLADEGEIGELADDYLSCMGGIYSQRRVREELIPDITERFQASGVEAALLIPM
jgi:D-proline reductase (dithiol) PrdB